MSRSTARQIRSANSSESSVSFDDPTPGNKPLSVSASGSRVAGVSAIHQRLALKADGYGGLVIFRNCRNLIRTLPAMVYDRKNPEDIDPACEEHAVKALMYGLTRRKNKCRVMRVRWAV
jgi:hypothetical protein